ncbi:DotU family type VI secretion system protein [Pseudoduganella sp. OTU4001]|uniref:DotU family type VI secretion system protein n=1 Tax=Pseudoduganella sp. OTU4001 TaxID=3043854 RepID=UPI00313B406B
MSQDDPFAAPDLDRTVVLPTPGGRQRTEAAPPAPSHDIPASAAAPVPAGPCAGLNPLVAAANPLLNVVPQLRASTHHPNPIAARDGLALQVKEFERRARAAGVSNEQVIAARYALCTLIDETAASTPWGGSGVWAGASLLVMFHNENWGGEKFFQLLSKLAERPAEHRDLLELMYICLALGLEGRYRVLDNGKAQLEALRERLAQLLRNTQGEYERDLSPQWQGVAVERKSLLAAVPLWVALGAAGVLMLGTYFALGYFLADASDPAFARIQALRVKMPAQAAPPPPLPAAQPRLAGFLAPEIEQGLLAVRDEQSRSVITIRGDGLFAPGSATLAPAYLGVMDRIAAGLATVPGKVQVIGHTDNQPMRSARFPSNWHLSQERAQAVVSLLQGKSSDPARFNADGRADAEPIAANATPAGRASNRRVEIVLTPLQGEGGGK